MDAIEMLSGDHREVEGLFERYGATESVPERQAIVGVLSRDLTKHAALEEEMLYPLMTRLAPYVDLDMERRLSLHADIKRTLVVLSGLSGIDQATDRLIGTLREQVGAHAQTDEESLLPRLRNLMDQQARDELGEVLLAAREIAPEQVRIRTPIDRPNLALTIPIATFCDRLVVGRGVG